MTNAEFERLREENCGLAHESANRGPRMLNKAWGFRLSFLFNPRLARLRSTGCCDVHL